MLTLALAATAALVRAETPETGEPRAPLIAAFGDSLSSGYGLEPLEALEKGFAPALQRALADISLRADVQNHGRAGDTTYDALDRVEWLLSEKPDIVVVEFGANDILRGCLPPSHTRANLDSVLEKIRAAGAMIVVAGMLAPLNCGKEHADAFNPIFSELAEKHEAEFYPFFLKDVVLVPELNLPDGLHPNAEGTSIIAKNIAPVVARAIQRWRDAQ